MSARYQFYCATEGIIITTPFQITAPTTCPNDASHDIGAAGLIERKKVPAVSTVIFRNTTTPFLLYSSLSNAVFTEIATIPFGGTSLLDPVTAIAIVGYNSSGNGVVTARLIDTTTNVVYATVTLPTTDNTSTPFTLNANFPTVATVMSFQVRTTGTGNVILKSLSIII